MHWRPEPDRSEPHDPWLASGSHDGNEIAPDEQPTTKLARCAYVGCRALIWRSSVSPCCTQHRAGLDDLSARVYRGELTDFPLGEPHRRGLARRPLIGWQKSFRTVVVNACYALRWWPWREPHFRGYPDGAPGAA